jgi:hypothetical protein
LQKFLRSFLERSAVIRFLHILFHKTLCVIGYSIIAPSCFDIGRYPDRYVSLLLRDANLLYYYVSSDVITEYTYEYSAKSTSRPKWGHFRQFGCRTTDVMGRSTVILVMFSDGNGSVAMATAGFAATRPDDGKSAPPSVSGSYMPFPISKDTFARKRIHIRIQIDDRRNRAASRFCNDIPKGISGLARAIGLRC